jgi:hypothetical protein
LSLGEGSFLHCGHLGIFVGENIEILWKRGQEGIKVSGYYNLVGWKLLSKLNKAIFELLYLLFVAICFWAEMCVDEDEILYDHVRWPFIPVDVLPRLVVEGLEEEFVVSWSLFEWFLLGYDESVPGIVRG